MQNIIEELLYLGILVNEVKDQHIKCLALELVWQKRGVTNWDLTYKEIQESFEELATCIRWKLLIPEQNKFRDVAIQYRKNC